MSLKIATFNKHANKHQQCNKTFFTILKLKLNKQLETKS